MRPPYCPSIKSRRDELAGRDAEPNRRYLISSLLALIAFVSIVCWKEIEPIVRTTTQDQAFLESAAAKGGNLATR